MKSIINENGFDIIGDIHGCYPQLVKLLNKLGYHFKSIDNRLLPIHPDGRHVVFVGDLIDRGPESLRCVDLVDSICTSGVGYTVMGNHEQMLIDYFYSNHFFHGNGTEFTIAEISIRDRLVNPPPGGNLENVINKIIKFPLKLKLESNGEIIFVSHSFFPYNMREDIVSVNMFDSISDLYLWNYNYKDILTWSGVDEYLVHGHIQTKNFVKLNGQLGEPIIHDGMVYSIDTSAAYGGRLTALKFPELEFESVNSMNYAAIPDEVMKIIQS